MRYDAKQLTEQFQAILLNLKTAVAEIQEQINAALEIRDERIAALEDRIAALEERA